MVVCEVLFTEVWYCTLMGDVIALDGCYDW